MVQPILAQEDKQGVCSPFNDYSRAEKIMKAVEGSRLHYGNLLCEYWGRDDRINSDTNAARAVVYSLLGDSDKSVDIIESIETIFGFEGGLVKETSGGLTHHVVKTSALFSVAYNLLGNDKKATEIIESIEMEIGFNHGIVDRPYKSVSNGIRYVGMHITSQSLFALGYCVAGNERKARRMINVMYEGEYIKDFEIGENNEVYDPYPESLLSVMLVDMMLGERERANKIHTHIEENFPFHEGLISRVRRQEKSPGFTDITELRSPSPYDTHPFDNCLLAICYMAEELRKHAIN